MPPTGSYGGTVSKSGRGNGMWHGAMPLYVCISSIRCECVVQVSGQKVVAVLHFILHLWSGITLLWLDRLQGELIPVEQVGLVSVHGDVKDYPLAHVTTATLKVGVILGLPHDLLIGHYCPIFWDLYEQKLKGPGPTPKKKEPSNKLINTGLQFVINDDIYQETCEPAETDPGPLELFVGNTEYFLWARLVRSRGSWEDLLRAQIPTKGIVEEDQIYPDKGLK